MPPKKTTTASAGASDQADTALITTGLPDLSPMEQKLLVALVLFQPNPRPKPDWERVREAVGSASVNATKVRYYSLVQKLKAQGHWVDEGGATGVEGASKSTPRGKGTRKNPGSTGTSVRKRKAKELEVAGEGDDEEMALDTPTKLPKREDQVADGKQLGVKQEDDLVAPQPAVAENPVHPVYSSIFGGEVPAPEYGSYTYENY